VHGIKNILTKRKKKGACNVHFKCLRNYRSDSGKVEVKG
jgi:hypothetical protein